MRIRVCTFALLLVAVLALPAAGAERKPAGKLVDSGSFGIFVNGRRVATETFQIEQMPDGNVTRSELKVDDTGAQGHQTAELLLTPAGDLRRYTWNELSPGKAQATVEPQNQILMEHLLASPTDKPLDQPFILPASTVILDDYFFAHRELLAWRYLGTACRPAPGQSECVLTRSQFGALIPRQRASILVYIEYVGKETVNIRGAARELSRFNLQGEGMDWQLWLDNDNKLVRITIAAEHTEVVRD